MGTTGDCDIDYYGRTVNKYDNNNKIIGAKPRRSISFSTDGSAEKFHCILTWSYIREINIREF